MDVIGVLAAVCPFLLAAPNTPPADPNIPRARPRSRHAAGVKEEQP
ncbi:hypothetical protein [Streptomyces sp. NPDC004629]